MIPPDLPPKTRAPSSVYSSNTPSVCSGTSSSAAAADFLAHDKPRVPPKVKAKNNGNNGNNGNGLTAERKQYFEGLSHSGNNER